MSKVRIVIVPGNGAGDVEHSNWYGWLRDKLREVGKVKRFKKTCTDGAQRGRGPLPRAAKREGLLACKQALRMGYSEICFRIARGRARRRALSLARPLAIRKHISE